MPRRPLIRPAGSRRSWRQRALIALLCCVIVLPITPALATLMVAPLSLQTPRDPALVTSHSMALTDLTPGTNYTYQVTSCDAAGNCTTSPEATFQTLALATSTLTPTLIPVATMTPPPTATVVPDAQFSSQASAAPPLVAPGQTSTITVTVHSSVAQSLLIDVEIYSPTTQVFQRVLDNRAFTAGQTRAFPISWAVPAGTSAGTYTVKVGLFTPGWGTLLDWNDAAGMVVISRRRR